ncbi:hypothetical protein MAR_019964 [Mya arenaria]|uniref:Uncharacterized protein n=1 Tax=Mya arenaria TaxID=6604 RepID=A0ABY7E3N8_MYAAR|nr:hypothetical protein MAR_019964 [Mya arenaria]
MDYIHVVLYVPTGEAFFQDKPSKGIFAKKGDTNVTAAVSMDRKPVNTLSSLSDQGDIRAHIRIMGREVMDLHQPHNMAAYK